MRDERGLEERCNGSSDRVMHDTVTDRSLVDAALLRIADGEGHVGPVSVRPVGQVGGEMEDVLLKSRLELLHVFTVLLPVAELIPGRE